MTSRDTEIERIAAALCQAHDGRAHELTAEALDKAHGAKARLLYDAGLRSQPASEPSLDVARWVQAITSEIEVDMAHGFPAGFGPEDLAMNIIGAYKALSQPADNEAGETAPDFGLQAFTRGFDGAGTDQE